MSKQIAGAARGYRYVRWGGHIRAHRMENQIVRVVMGKKKHKETGSSEVNRNRQFSCSHSLASKSGDRVEEITTT